MKKNKGVLLDKKIPVAKYYKDDTSSYDINIYAEEIQWKGNTKNELRNK